MRLSLRPEEYFYLRSGSSLKSIEELSDAIDSISKDDFLFHVNSEKNDFANWTKDVFDEKELAEKLFLTRTKEGAKKVLKEFFEPVQASVEIDKKVEEDKVVKESKPIEPIESSVDDGIVKDDKKSYDNAKPNKRKETKEDKSFGENKQIQTESIKQKETDEKRPSFFSKLWLKIKSNKFLGKTIFKKTYVDNQLEFLDDELQDFHEEVEEKLSNNE